MRVISFSFPSSPFSKVAGASSATFGRSGVPQEKLSALNARADEVLASEALQTLKKVYLDPLRMVADAPRGVIFTHEELDAIFLNVDVITKVNDKFLGELLAEEPLGARDVSGVPLHQSNLS